MDFDLILHALSSVMTFFLIGCVGYCLAKRKQWFSIENKILITNLITLVALPPYLMYNINTSLTKEELRHLAFGLLPAYISIIMLLLLSFVLIRLLAVPKNHHGAFTASVSFSNTIYIGLPVNLALFGPTALPYVLIYYFANTSLFWSVGNYLLASDGDMEDKPSLLSLSSLKKIISPPMYGFLAGLVLLALDLKLPTVIANSAKTLGGIVTPLVLISIGVTLSELDFRKIRFNWELFFILFSRAVLSPLSIILLTWFMPMPELMRKVFIIQASLPVMSSVAIMASYYRADVEYATVSVSASTLLALVTIPFYMVLGNYLA